MGGTRTPTLRIAVVGGGPAGSFFALYALRFARQAGRDVAITIYDGKDFRRFCQPGCNMCAGIIPAGVLSRFAELDLTIPPALVLSRISSYALHTSAGSLVATQPDARAEIISVYRGSGPRYGHPPEQLSFDEFLIEEAIARGARRQRAYVEAVRPGPPHDVVSGGVSEPYDLVVLATGVNGFAIQLHGLAYRPPPTGAMCQTELYLGRDEVQRQLGPVVHLFLPPDEIASYGILIPKGPFVTVSLVNPRAQMRSLRQFLALPEVRTVLDGGPLRQVCGCLPNVSLGPAGHVAADGFVAIGDASSTRLYKNGIGSALATARQAAWTAVTHGCRAADFARHYLPVCRAIDRDNRIGKLCCFWRCRRSSTAG
jgi:flavin-dependent dehydrogenase